MFVVTTGKRFYNVNKNLESQDRSQQSLIGRHRKQGSDFPVVAKIPAENPDANTVKEAIIEKDSHIKQLQNLLAQSPRTEKSNSSQAVVNSPYLNPELSSRLYKDHASFLNKQIEDRQRGKIQDAISKEKEVRNRLCELNYMRDSQLKDRIESVKKAEEYRRALEVQQEFNNRVEEKKIIERNFYLPLIHFRNGRGHTQSMDVLKTVPKITKELAIPKKKNLNNLVAEFSTLAAFQQPKYTKLNPKVVPSFPVIGSSNSLLI
jgi:hypothetical protein